MLGDGKPLPAKFRAVPQIKNLIGAMAANWESLTETDLGVSAQERARFKGAWDEHRRVFGYAQVLSKIYVNCRRERFDDRRDSMGFRVVSTASC